MNNPDFPGIFGALILTFYNSILSSQAEFGTHPRNSPNKNMAQRGIAGRSKLPLVFRRKVQYCVRIFVFIGIFAVTTWGMLTACIGYYFSQDMLKMHGFVPGIV